MFMTKLLKTTKWFNVSISSHWFHLMLNTSILCFPSRNRFQRSIIGRFFYSLIFISFSSVNVVTCCIYTLGNKSWSYQNVLSCAHGHIDILFWKVTKYLDSAEIFCTWSDRGYETYFTIISPINSIGSWY